MHYLRHDKLYEIFFHCTLGKKQIYPYKYSFMYVETNILLAQRKYRLVQHSFTRLHQNILEDFKFFFFGQLNNYLNAAARMWVDTTVFFEISAHGSCDA